MAEFREPHLDEKELGASQVKADQVDKKLSSLRLSLDWYNRALLNPKEYFGKERPSQKEKDETTTTRQFIFCSILKFQDRFVRMKTLTLLLMT